LIGLLLVADPILGCRSEHETPEWLQAAVAKLARRLKAIDATDGVDMKEAEEIANIYRSEYINGCGAALQPTLAGDLWTSELLLGYAGRKSNRIVRVHARTGGVWSEGGPSYRDLSSFHRGVLGDFLEKRL
jgi:hypothetical protein